MSDEISEPMRTELFAASLRADKNDLKTFLDALAFKLEGSLLDYTRVTRQGSIFSRERPVSGWKQNMEVNVLTQAMYHARGLAMTRMEEEANALGADGVVGVRLLITEYQWGESMAEFMAIGTAIRSRTGQPYRNAHGKPFTSDLSGQDFWTLLKAGYRPVGMVMGNCVYHVAHQSLGQVMRQVGQNVEFANYTQAVYDARELAMERMQAEASSLGAQGIVGVNIIEDSRSWGSHVIEFFAVGTAILPISAEHQIPPPALTLSLNS